MYISHAGRIILLILTADCRHNLYTSVGGHYTFEQMVTIDDIIEKLELDQGDLEIQKENKRIKRARLKYVGDKVSLASFDRISKRMTQEFGGANDKDDTHGEKSWTWNIDGNTVHLHLFEQHCFKLALTITSGRYNDRQQHV